MYEQTVRGDDFYAKRVYISCRLNTISFLIYIIRLSIDRAPSVSTYLTLARAPTVVNFRAREL